ncbi:hypothetical protein [Reinekea blandensis]|uniref:Uncharacterized protein n=1 Tax=Reinekea blandensis MED297 TaxID=314283 RepID=A4BCP7_9GAMM|nr:hypothetical protein [Reinekea blandensis]EAR09979.1 hypothetical protein MED297_07821 [Reinekea sp. MED297] [Reinekea blandensis MED297]
MLVRLNLTTRWLVALLMSVAVLWLPVAAQTMSLSAPMSDSGCAMMLDVDTHDGSHETICLPDTASHTDCADCDTGSCPCPQLTLVQSSEFPGAIDWSPGFSQPVPGFLPQPLLSGLERPPRF